MDTADGKVNRREFLHKSMVVAAGSAALRNTALSYSRIAGANDRISLGHIGIGNRGSELDGIVARLKDITKGGLCEVVYDGVGKTTFPGSLSCLKPRGLFVSFGNASGPVPPFALAELNNHGSLFATRPKLNDYVSTRKELLEGADTLFAAVINGKLHVPINHAYALKDVAKAHIELESRATTGAAILRP